MFNPNLLTSFIPFQSLRNNEGDLHFPLHMWGGGDECPPTPPPHM